MGAIENATEAAVAATAVKQKESPASWQSGDASLITVLVVDTVASLICAFIIMACIMWLLGKRARRREERDKLSDIIRTYYWDNEEQISQTLQTLVTMNQNIIHRDITELHVLAYKYRCDSGVYGLQDHVDDGISTFARTPFPPPPNTPPTPLQVLKKIERLFETLALQLPCTGTCPDHVGVTFGSTLFSLAHGTVLIWSDSKARLIRSLVHYFAGKQGGERFVSGLMADEELETLVLARVPYISLIHLNQGHYVMREVDISSDLRIDLRNKIRYVDTVLAKNTKTLQEKERSLIECYYTARELCIKNSFIQNKSNYPDIVTKVGEASKVGECVVYLRHLLRTMCISYNLKKVEADDKFFQFLMQLHETLYSWSDTNIMLEVIERVRGNIYAYLRGLTVEQMLIDREFTKVKLEHLEKELYRHLNYLTTRQVQQEKMKRLAVSKSDQEPRLRYAESDSSIYTMAMSTSSFLMHRQASHDHDRARQLDLEYSSLQKQRSLDQSSLLSGQSSMYATAASVSSGENAPLIGQSPLTQSPASPRHQSDRPSSPIPPDDDFYETAV